MSCTRPAIEESGSDRPHYNAGAWPWDAPNLSREGWLRPPPSLQHPHTHPSVCSMCVSTASCYAESHASRNHTFYLMVGRCLGFLFRLVPQLQIFNSPICRVSVLHFSAPRDSARASTETRKYGIFHWF